MFNCHFKIIFTPNDFRSTTSRCANCALTCRDHPAQNSFDVSGSNAMLNLQNEIMSMIRTSMFSSDVLPVLADRLCQVRGVSEVKIIVNAKEQGLETKPLLLEKFTLDRLGIPATLQAFLFTECDGIVQSRYSYSMMVDRIKTSTLNNLQKKQLCMLLKQAMHDLQWEQTYVSTEHGKKIYFKNIELIFPRIIGYASPLNVSVKLTSENPFPNDEINHNLIRDIFHNFFTTRISKRYQNIRYIDPVTVAYTENMLIRWLEFKALHSIDPFLGIIRLALSGLGHYNTITHHFADNLLMRVCELIQDYFDKECHAHAKVFRYSADFIIVPEGAKRVDELTALQKSVSEYVSERLSDENHVVHMADVASPAIRERIAQYPASPTGEDKRIIPLGDLDYLTQGDPAGKSKRVPILATAIGIPTFNAGTLTNVLIRIDTIHPGRDPGFISLNKISHLAWNRSNPILHESLGGLSLNAQRVATLHKAIQEILDRQGAMEAKTYVLKEYLDMLNLNSISKQKILSVFGENTESIWHLLFINPLADDLVFKENAKELLQGLEEQGLISHNQRNQILGFWEDIEKFSNAILCPADSDDEDFFNGVSADLQKLRFPIAYMNQRLAWLQFSAPKGCSYQYEDLQRVRCPHAEDIFGYLIAAIYFADPANVTADPKGNTPCINRAATLRLVDMLVERKNPLNEDDEYLMNSYQANKFMMGRWGGEEFVMVIQTREGPALVNYDFNKFSGYNNTWGTDVGNAMMKWVSENLFGEMKTRLTQNGIPATLASLRTLIMNIVNMMNNSHSFYQHVFHGQEPFARYLDQQIFKGRNPVYYQKHGKEYVLREIATAQGELIPFGFFPLTRRVVLEEINQYHLNQEVSIESGEIVLMLDLNSLLRFNHKGLNPVIELHKPFIRGFSLAGAITSLNQQPGAPSALMQILKGDGSAEQAKTTGDKDYYASESQEQSTTIIIPAEEHEASP